MPLKFVLKGLINNIPALVQMMAWRMVSAKPLLEPMLVRLLMHVCVTPPRWVKWNSDQNTQISFQNFVCKILGISSKSQLFSWCKTLCRSHLDWEFSANNTTSECITFDEIPRRPNFVKYFIHSSPIQELDKSHPPKKTLIMKQKKYAKLPPPPPPPPPKKKKKKSKIFRADVNEIHCDWSWGIHKFNPCHP